MRIVSLTEADAERYRMFYRRAADCMIYYSWDYRRLMEALLGCTPHYLAAEDSGGDLRAILPLMASEGPYGTVYNSLPFFGSHGGVIGERGEPERMLWRSLSELADAPGVAAATVIMHPLRMDEPPFRHDLTDERIGQITNLEGAADAQSLRMRIAASARYDVRLAERAGVTVAIDNGAFAALQAMHDERLAALGGLAKPAAFFTLVPRIFSPGEDFDLYVAHQEGQLLAALLVLYGGGIAEYFVPAVRPEHRSSQPTAAILFRAMQDATSRGCRLWNWGGTWLTQEGVMRFKRNWGATDYPYRYYTRVGNPALFDASKDELLAAYAGFYVLPFDKLKAKAGSQIR
jgi:Acetyltransferase (GNAT) domain